MSRKGSFVAPVLAFSALWAAPALAEDSYRTVSPDAKVAAAPTKASKMATGEPGDAPAVGGSGMTGCSHIADERCGHLEHVQQHARRMERRSMATGHSLHPVTGPEPLRH
jgi:hypothetical protein